MPFSFPIGRLETRKLIDRAVFNVSTKLPTQYRFGYMGDLTGDDITIRQTSVSVHGLNDESEDDADRIRTLAVAQSRPAVCQEPTKTTKPTMTDQSWRNPAKRYQNRAIFDNTTEEILFTARCTVVQSAVLRSHVVCPSVCNVGEL